MKHSVHQFKLPGGTHGLLIDVPGSAVFNLSAIFNSGNIFGQRDKFEVSHIMEHLMGCGTKQWPSAKQFKSEVEKNGAYRNASTGPLTNEYIYECADFELERLTSLLCEQITSPLLPEAAFAAEVSNVREELARNVGNYSRVAYQLLANATMPQCALPDDQRIKQLPDITLGDIQEYYQRTHHRRNLRLLLAGDLKGRQASIIDQFKRGVAGMPVGERLEVPALPPVTLTEPLVASRDIPQIYYYLHIYASFDYAQRPVLALMNQLFTGGWSSWVLGEARERGLAYGVGSHSLVGPHSQYSGFSGFVRPDNSQPLFELMVVALKRAAAGQFEAAELAAAKTMQIGRLLRSYQTPADILDWYADDYNAWGVVNHFDGFIKQLEAVEPADITAVATRLLESRRWGLSLVGNITKKRATDLYDTLNSIWQ